MRVLMGLAAGAAAALATWAWRQLDDPAFCAAPLERAPDFDGLNVVRARMATTEVYPAEFHRELVETI
ncbi:MAG: hypothetical protein AB7L13_11330 [Acidimicrobiia bacterium]